MKTSDTSALYAYVITLPEYPGVYLFKGFDGYVLYVGKAKNIRTRVSSYFHRQNADAKIKNLLESSVALDFILTNSEQEALILENNLIKHHKPEFNVLLKYGGGYPYLTITTEKFPAITIAHSISNQIGGDNVEVYGPYIGNAHKLLTNLTKLFGLRTCNNHYFKSRVRACIRHSIGLCSAPCVGLISLDDYSEQVTSAKLLLSKNQVYKLKLLANFKENMIVSSRILDFESANKYKHYMDDVEAISRVQIVELKDKADMDVIVTQRNSDVILCNVMRYLKGALLEKLFFEFSIVGDLLSVFQMIYRKISLPDKVVVEPNMLDDSATMSFFFCRG